MRWVRRAAALNPLAARLLWVKQPRLALPHAQVEAEPQTLSWLQLQPPPLPQPMAHHRHRPLAAWMTRP